MQRLRFLVSALCCFVVTLGCNEIAGIKDPVGASPDSYVGTWVSTDSTIALTECTGSGTGALDPITLVITKGTTTPLDIVVGGGCHLATQLEGSAASLLPDQGCQFPATADSVAQIQAYGPSTFELLANSTTRASARITGGVRFSPDTTMQMDCTFEQLGTYNRQ